jgi:hypothetical protein
MSAAHAFNQGTIFLILTLPWPWPPTSDLLLLEGPLVDGRWRIVARTDATIQLELHGEAENTVLRSCRLNLTEPTSTNVGFSWMLPDSMHMIVGQSLVASLESPQMVPKEANIVNGVPNDRKDFAECGI